jgi:hypothetical protein
MASSKSRRNNRKNSNIDLVPVVEQLKNLVKTADSPPVRLLAADILGKKTDITNASLTQPAIDLLKKIVEDSGIQRGETFSLDNYDIFNAYGAEEDATLTSSTKSQKGLAQRVGSFSPADELKFSLGRLNLFVDDEGIVRSDDAYNFNSFVDFAATPDKDGRYPTYSTEEFEEAGFSTLDVLSSLANSPELYKAVRNIGFLLGSRGSEKTPKAGRQVKLDLGRIEGGSSTSPLVSKRPKSRAESKKEKQEAQKLTPADAPSQEDVLKYLDEFKDRELSPKTSVRPQARPKDETAELFGEVSGYLDKLSERTLSPETSVRPQARPTRTVEAPAAEPASVDTDSMSFGDAFKYYTDNTDQDVFEWRGNKYKAERKFAEGGVVDKQMNRLYQEGGLADDGARVEPVTGNEVPPGSMDQEVRDNVDAKLSEGEYVVPADVVRYYGVRFFEDLRAKAKEDFSKMESEGRIGGEPVDAQGVPMEDDELTPEEMQMLAEALGQAPQGMAMGGMVQQQPIPAYNPYAQQQMQYNNPNMRMPVGMAEGGEVKAPEFNPSQYQLYPSGNQMGAGSGGGIEIVDYINVETGQIRPVTLMNGQPMGLVPEGFVRATPENRKQAMENAGMASEQMGEKTTEEVLDVRDDSESDQRRMEQAGQTEASYTNWAEENYDKIQKDPVGYIKDRLTGKDTFGDKLLEGGARLAAGLGPLGIAAAGVGMGYKELRPLAEARAALKTMDPLSDQYKEAESIIEKYDDELKGIYNFADDTLNLASGDNLYEGLVDYGKTLGTTGTTSKPKQEFFVPSSKKKTRTEDGAAEEKRAQERYDAFEKQYEENVKDAQENQYGQTTGKGLTVDDEDLFSPPGMAEGGLVAKPSNYKSKVTRKTEKKRRGLGSK